MVVREHVAETALEDAARFGLLQAPSFADIRTHVLACASCRARLEEMEEFVSFLHASPAEETSGELAVKAAAGTGTVFLVIEGTDAEEGWQAHGIGGGRYETRWFAKGEDARAWLEGWRRETFRGPLRGPTRFARDIEGGGSTGDRLAIARSFERASPAASTCK